MRPVSHSFLLLVVALAGNFVVARPASHLLRRQDDASSTGSPESQSDAQPTDSTSSSESSSSAASSSTASNSESSSSVSSASSSSQSTVTGPTSTLSSLPTSSSVRPPPTTSPTLDPVPNTPAGFFSNSSATLILGVTLGGIAGIILILVLWLNFRRAWYFPWNKKKQRNDPTRWSVYSFKEKPRLPLGRAPPPTSSMENFAKPTDDGAPSEGHGEIPELDEHIPPVPDILIHSPPPSVHSSAKMQSRRSVTWASDTVSPTRPAHIQRSRWSAATTQASVSVYSQPSETYTNGDTTDKEQTDKEETDRDSYLGESARDTPVTRVTSASSEAPFRFDELLHGPRSAPLIRQGYSRDVWTATNSAPSTPGFPSRAVTRGMDRGIDLRPPGLSGLERLVESSSSGNEKPKTIGRSVSARGPRDSPDRNWDQDQTTVSPYDVAAALRSQNSSLTRSITNPDSKKSPKGILKNPHYLTTTARLAQNGKPNMI
ncbi:hypothetical protein CPB86DRAFT_801376 [Serendipita vermifera]|nr:hypothetical protein CPB86DRAFT_801376 [Serendipita vermifera]